ncbi:MAG: hypothetical protein WD059_08680 [Balneolaceae bacterium]
MSTENTFDFNSSEYKEFIKKYRNKETKTHSLIVFAGEFSTDRSSAIDELQRETMGEAIEVDLSEIITQNEEESYSNIDASLEKIDDDVPLVIFRNAELLNGAYTGYSNSQVIYSTPQEKYFLKKIKQISAPVLLELSNVNQLDMTLARTADVVVHFNAPSSFLEKMAWKFQNIHVHGSRFLSPRPVQK